LTSNMHNVLTMFDMFYDDIIDSFKWLKRFCC
jgi:hypothetical protein